MLIDSAQIQKLIPHAGKMSLLSAVLRWDATHITCAASSHRDSDNPMSRGGKVPTLAGIEYAAQAMAVHGGLTGLVGQRPRAGFLVNVRDIQAESEYLSDYKDDLQVDAEQLISGENSVTYSFRIRSAEHELLSGRAMVVMDAGEPTT